MMKNLSWAAALLRISLCGVAPACVTMFPLAAYAEGPAHFTVTDQIAQQEISESTEIYIDGKLLAKFKLDRATPTRTVQGEVADGDDRHSYALCGEITVGKPGGGTEIHEVNSGGTISDLDGRAFQALGAANFTFFYLADGAPGRALPMPSAGRSAVCHPALS